MSTFFTSARLRHLALVSALMSGVVALLYALEPAVVTDTARSPRALGVVALTTVACMVFGRLGRRWLGSPGGAVGAVIPLALVGWLVIAPAVRDVTLVEALPVGAGELDPPVAAPAPGTPTPSASVPAPAAPAAPAAAASTPAGVPRSVSTPAPRSASTPTRPTASRPAAASPPASPAAPPPSSSSSGPTKVSSGRIEGINHTASGTVAIYRLADGSHIVRFEDVALEGAPDPVLWLVPGRDQRSRDGGREVAPLKATHGSFNHTVPAGFDVGQDFTVFIWCERYATPIANATQNRL